ncbi:hypothetical protein [Clostridium cellulovorans]|uniref:ATP-grasp domain-containing protein n=1 Tax=Clostridium cellulovorans (strain ATCC 35296 / DSM 3052 / OCM 3 / 743B) TaxID=573061 RepID=D9SU81_CLOC7|nr:hypothetical protein [Clostridium cellulovorans]ADL52836.1 hypothetical protein Clocel_3149 [Clostridium cellulovorans 743B]
MKSYVSLDEIVEDLNKNMASEKIIISCRDEILKKGEISKSDIEAFKKAKEEFLNGKSMLLKIFNDKAKFALDWSFLGDVYSDNFLDIKNENDSLNIKEIDMRYNYYLQVLSLLVTKGNNISLVSNSALEGQIGILNLWIEKNILSLEDINKIYVINDLKNIHWSKSGNVVQAIAYSLNNNIDLSMTKLSDFLDGKITLISPDELRKILSNYKYFTPFYTKYHDVLKKNSINIYVNSKLIKFSPRNFLYNIKESGIFNESLIPLGNVFKKDEKKSFDKLIRKIGVEYWLKLDGTSGSTVLKLNVKDDVEKIIKDFEKINIINKSYNNLVRPNCIIDNSFELEIAQDIGTKFNSENMNHFNIQVGVINTNDVSKKFLPVIINISDKKDIGNGFAWGNMEKNLKGRIIEKLEQPLLSLCKSLFDKLKEDFIISLEGFAGYLKESNEFDVCLLEANLRISGSCLITLTVHQLFTEIFKLPTETPFVTFNFAIKFKLIELYERIANKYRLGFLVLGYEKDNIYKILIYDKYNLNSKFYENIKLYVEYLKCNLES